MPTASRERCDLNVKLWHDQGYRVALLMDAPGFDVRTFRPDLTIHVQTYQGYYKSMNQLARSVFNRFGPRMVVFAGDDMRPGCDAQKSLAYYLTYFPNLDGVVQPIGDDLPGTDRICGSPWIGSEFYKTAYGGNGPYPDGYFHFYGDEELFNVTKNTDRLFQLKAVAQYHDHWTRRGRRDAIAEKHQHRWDDDKALFARRRDGGFPGHNLTNLSHYDDINRTHR